MKVLLLSAYDATSHRSWAQRLIESFADYTWTVLRLPARHFNWRVRGNSLSWAFQQRSLLCQPYNLIIATSMVDLSALRGFVPELCACPTMVYFHENQFAYPKSGREVRSIEPQILSLYTALAADKVVFNSQYNQDTFLNGARTLLKKMPDCVPQGLPAFIAERSAVVPVPLEKSCFIPSTTNTNDPLVVLWNHRWEYDKGPERLFTAIKNVLDSGIVIHLYIVGQQFQQQPAVFEHMYTYLQTYYPTLLKQWGFVESIEQYRSILACADVVLSTALHDFQGLSVLEAVAAGCIPLLPNRLAYAEWFEPQYFYDSYEHNAESETKAIAEDVRRLARLKIIGNLPMIPDVSALCVNQLKDKYTQLFSETINRHSQLAMEPVS